MEALLKGSAGGKGGGGDGLEGKRNEFHGEDDPSDMVGSGRSSSSSEQHGSKLPSSPEHGDSVISNSKQASPVGLTEISSMDASPRPPQLKDFSACKLNQLESAKAEMGEMKEENERLKMILARIVKDYQSLQMQFYGIVQQERDKNSTGSASHNDQLEMEESELVSLRLGTTPISRPKKEDHIEVLEAPTKGKDDGKPREVLTLGLDCKFDERKDHQIKDPPKSESTENSLEEAAKDEKAGGEQPWPPSNALKTQRSGEDELSSQQAQVKKARVSVRARCDAPTMNDGCQWRKYGQKIAKGNPCPRAYYRCTVAPGCSVRKQVQRCAEDMSILITTYEGTHNHPLPISATAMASTTSAAACMLMSGSSTSGCQVVGTSSSVTTTLADLHGLNFGLSDNSGSRPFYLSNHSISSSPSYPTITLDLTAPQSSSPNFQLNRFSTSFSSFPARPSSTSFNFTTAESVALSSPWSSTGNNYISYNTSQLPYSKSQIGSFNLATTQPQDRVYQSYMQKSTTKDHPQAGLSETIAAATKVLTSDPNFRSALAAAITSIVSNGGSSSSSNAHGRGDAQLGHTLKWGEQFHSMAPFTAAATNSCATTFLSRSSNNTPRSDQPGNFMFLPPTSLPFSSAKSASTSPVDNRERTS